MAKLIIVGSGFTKAIAESAPVNDELFNSLQIEDPKTASEILAEYGDNIELALTRLDIDIATNATAERHQTLRLRIEHAITEIFKRYRYGYLKGTLANKPWLKSCISTIFKPTDVVVSLNYDCLLEGVLDDYGLWSPNGGYLFKNVMLCDPHEYARSKVVVLKIHGSENFQRQLVIGHSNYSSFKYEVDETLYPKSGQLRHICTDNEGNMPGIIAPSYLKLYHSTLMSLYLKAIETAKEVDTLLLIGCGVRKEDQLLHILIWSFIQGYVENPNRKIIIIDPNATKISQRLSDTFEYPIGKIVYPLEYTLVDGWEKYSNKFEDQIANKIRISSDSESARGRD